MLSHLPPQPFKKGFRQDERASHCFTMLKTFASFHEAARLHLASSKPVSFVPSGTSANTTHFVRCAFPLYGSVNNTSYYEEPLSD